MLLVDIALGCVFQLCTASQAKATPAQADYYSANRVYVLHITPDQNQPARQGWCLAQWYKSSGMERTLIWERYLINNAAPANALVADSGKYVVAVGDWGQLDTVPLVVYGAQGEVRKLLTSETPLPGVTTAEYGAAVLGDGSMRALLYFGPGDTTLFIHLAGIDTYTFWLEDGLLTDRDWYSFATNNCDMSREDCEVLKAFAGKRLAELTMEYIQSADARLRETGAIVAGDLHLQDAIPQLQQLLQDQPQDLDPRKVGTKFLGGMMGPRFDPAFAARLALIKIAEYQEQGEKETLVPKDAADKAAWAQILDRGQQTKNPAPLQSFLNCWQSDRQGIAPEVLQSKPEFEQAIYAMFPPFFLPEASQKTAKYLIVQDEIKVRLVDGDLADDYRREGYGGSIALMQRDDQGWRVMGRESTWVE